MVSVWGTNVDDRQTDHTMKICVGIGGIVHIARAILYSNNLPLHNVKANYSLIVS